MHKYLLEILKETNTIIIPGLGALTITNTETGEIMFMSYLKHDDGKLAAFISEKESMDENEAKNLIAKYVREIQGELDKGEDFMMYQFGAFYKNGEDIEFKNWNQVQSSTENIYIPPVKEEPTAEKTSTVDAEEKVAPIIEKEEKVIVPPVTVKEIPVDKKEELEATQAKLNQLRKDGEKDHKKKKGVGFWIGIILLALLIGGGTIFGLNYDTLKDKIPFLAHEEKTYTIDEKNEIENVDPIDENADTENLDDSIVEEITDDEINVDDSFSEDEIEQSENIEEEVVEEPLPVIDHSTSGEFHIIVGAFSSLQNAEKLVATLKAQGYPAEIKSGRKLHKVSVKSYSTRKEATLGLKELKEVAPSGWVDQW